MSVSIDNGHFDIDTMRNRFSMFVLLSVIGCKIKLGRILIWYVCRYVICVRNRNYYLYA